MPSRRPYFQTRSVVADTLQTNINRYYLHEYAAKSLNPEKTPLSHEIYTLAQNCKAWKRMEVGNWDPPSAP